MTEWASRRCAELILEVAGGTLHPGVIDVGRPACPNAVRSPSGSTRSRGSSASRSSLARSANILTALGLEWLGRTESSVTFRPPSWRPDLEREIDLIEEVARIHGYEHIPEDRAVPLTSAPRGPPRAGRNGGPRLADGPGARRGGHVQPGRRCPGLPVGPGSGPPPLRVEHSSRKRENALRQSLIPSLLAVRRHNEAHGNPDAELFEIANVYLPRPDQPSPTSRPGWPWSAAATSGRSKACSSLSSGDCTFPRPWSPTGRGAAVRTRSRCRGSCWVTFTLVTWARSIPISSRHSISAEPARRPKSSSPF